MKKNQLRPMIEGICILAIVLVILLIAQVVKHQTRGTQHLNLLSQAEKVAVKLYDSEQMIFDEVGQVPNAIYHFSKEQQSNLAELMNFKEWKEDKRGIKYDMALSMVIQISGKDCYYLFPNIEGQTYIEMYNTTYFAPKAVYETVKDYIISQGELEQEGIEDGLMAEIIDIEDGRLLVKGSNEEALKIIGDACYLAINKEQTMLLDAEGKKVNLSYLKTGMQLKIKLLGGVLESYPCQAEASIIQVIQQ